MPPTPLDACSRQALEDHFRASQPGPDPRGLFEGRFLCWVDGPPPSMRLVDTLLFRALRFGVDFDRGVWWFVRPRVTVGRFRSSRGPSRWREAEVLRLVSEGLTNQRIARRLGIQFSTVRTHVEHARQKLGCTTRAEAVARALHLGWL